jgi:hypothetical protein
MILVAGDREAQRSVMPDGKPAAAPWHLLTYEFPHEPLIAVAESARNDRLAMPAHFLCVAQEMGQPRVLDAHAGFVTEPVRSTNVLEHIEFLSFIGLARSLNVVT